MTTKKGGRTQSDKDKHDELSKKWMNKKEKAAEDILKEFEKLFKKFGKPPTTPTPKPRRKLPPPPLVKQREAKVDLSRSSKGKHKGRRGSYKTQTAKRGGRITKRK